MLAELPVKSGLRSYGGLQSIAFIISWIIVYAVGYCFANVKTQGIYVILVVISSLGLTCIVKWHDFLQYFNILNRLWHDMVGISYLVAVNRMLCLYSRIQLPGWISLLDKYSFYVYIVHYFLLIGPFSMAHLFDNMLMNIIVSIGAILVFTIIFIKICNILNAKIQISRK